MAKVKNAEEDPNLVGKLCFAADESGLLCFCTRQGEEFGKLIYKGKIRDDDDDDDDDEDPEIDDDDDENPEIDDDDDDDENPEIDSFGTLMTWWDFNPQEVGIPSAFINNENKCEHHATNHMITYDVLSKATVIDNGDGSVSYFFSMSLGGGGFGTCKFRCWDTNLPQKDDGYFDVGYDYYQTKESHRAEILGNTMTVARFELLKKKNGAWVLKALS